LIFSYFWYGKSKFDESCIGGILDSEMVGASEDLEGTIVTPSFVPGVDHEPVLGAILHSPSDDFNGVASELRPTSVLVNT
jgi:hypothetical protein